ncbi:YD repeat-containing protein [Pseudomonas sp. EB276 TE3739]
MLEERLPDGGQRKYRYDALGRQITRQDEFGAITQYQWNAVDRLTQVTLPGGATRGFTYNPYGRVTAERDELGRITRYEYADNLHLVSRRINPDGSQLRYRYDNSQLNPWTGFNGRLLKKTMSSLLHTLREQLHDD